MSEIRRGHPSELIAYCRNGCPYCYLVLTSDPARFGSDMVAARWTNLNSQKPTEPFILDTKELAATISLGVFTKFRLRGSDASVSVLTSNEASKRLGRSTVTAKRLHVI